MEVLKIRLDKDSPWIEIPAIVGPPGPKGADGTVSFNDLTEEQKASLKGDTGPAGPAGERGPAGPKGDSYIITEDDKNEIAAIVLSNFPSGEGVEY